ncbi:homeodomain-interacting protein kinase 1-like isoform X1 [Takifugu rubripes]|uniref:homeodomain-interacting protein kinase 1-like isoform X1 n=1 Tax=Takifugu rubripes TaxID=31033 RepID=UPI0011458FC6|nr:homeodomain-interacting protein kinase 1-like isoform X1 [Takifugu rubripes]
MEIMPSTINKVSAGDVLHSRKSGFVVQEIIGEGAFGQVARCQNMNTKATVAIKFIKDSKEFESGQREKMILERIHSSLRVNHAHFVKLLDHFQHNSQLSLVYEMLSMDFVDALELRKGKPLCVSKIRPIAKQLFMALSDLKKLGILHTDLKPDNIMLVDQRGLKIKLIDFGLARRTHEARTGTIMQASGLRAPEIMLGLPFSYPLDIWGVGQILLFLYNPQTIHNYSSYQNMRHIIDLLGMPPNYILNAGRYTSRYFVKVANHSGYSWRLKTPAEYGPANLKNFKDVPQYFRYSLTQLFSANPTNDKNEMKDRRALYDLLKKLFHFDDLLRISPAKALQHDFITMGHLRTVESKDYLKICEKMNSLAFTEVSADNSNEKRNEKNLFESEIRRSSQKEAKTLEKEEKPTKEGDIKSFMGKVFKAECSESSEAETSETSEAEAIMSLKGQFTQSLEEIDCEPSQKEIIGTLPEKDINFPEELLCLSLNSKSTEGEANKDKHTESQVEEESESSQKEICDTKSTESPVEYIESLQQESSEESISDTSCADTSVENDTSLCEEESVSSNGTSDGASSEADSYSSEGVSCSDSCDYSDATTSENGSKSPPKKKRVFRVKVSKWFAKVCRHIKSVSCSCMEVNCVE